MVNVGRGGGRKDAQTDRRFIARASQGGAREPRLLRGLPDDELNQRAIAAIQSWVFRPGMKDGQPIPVIAVFTVTYRLH